MTKSGWMCCRGVKEWVKDGDERGPEKVSDGMGHDLLAYVQGPRCAAEGVL